MNDKVEFIDPAFALPLAALLLALWLVDVLAAANRDRRKMRKLNSTLNK